MDVTIRINEGSLPEDLNCDILRDTVIREVSDLQGVLSVECEIGDFASAVICDDYNISNIAENVVKNIDISDDVFYQ